ncbi:hypothetical protein MLD38_022711 [Melastoma candidum]|uniref:Uncharacterized protein n=1 Tax=Melastoma candidum TaxID=119954 RepID=A0ACB9QLD3_9MYRT|nr:hypothetical protein MLD38_022711 [Melastoma candidum]
MRSSPFDDGIFTMSGEDEISALKDMFRHFFGRFSRKHPKQGSEPGGKPGSDNQDGGSGAGAGARTGTNNFSAIGSADLRSPVGDAKEHYVNAVGNRGSQSTMVSLTQVVYVSKDRVYKHSQEMYPKPRDIASFDKYEALPQFKDVPYEEKQNLFVRKLALCCVVFDFRDLTKNVKEKEIKRQTLMELVDYVISANVMFSEDMVRESVTMVSVNLFRTLTTPSHENRIVESFDLEDEEPSMDPAWPHLQLLYEFIMRFVASPAMDVKLAKKYIGQPFIARLLDLFESEDPRERECLKTTTHRIYGKLMVHRPYIRKSINNTFYRFIFETEKHNGIAELLEILGSVINGFALPIKEEHKAFLVRVLIPLHKPKSLLNYHQQLSYCVTQFVDKDCKLAETIIRGLLKYWPVTNSMKEVMFIGELEEVLEATQSAEFQRCMEPLFRQIGASISSPHFQVAERALFLWNNDRIVELIKQNRGIILPIVFPALEKNTKSHWNQVVQSLTQNVRKIFWDVDRALFEECSAKFKEAESQTETVKSRNEAAWERLEEMAARNSTS